VHQSSDVRVDLRFLSEFESRSEKRQVAAPTDGTLRTHSLVGTHFLSNFSISFQSFVFRITIKICKTRDQTQRETLKEATLANQFN